MSITTISTKSNKFDVDTNTLVIQPGWITYTRGGYKTTLPAHDINSIRTKIVEV